MLVYGGLQACPDLSEYDMDWVDVEERPAVQETVRDKCVEIEGD